MMGNKGERAVEALEEISRQLETFVVLMSGHPNEPSPPADPSQVERLLREFVDCLDGAKGRGTELDDLDLVYRKARKFLEKKEGD
jgi:hypothetical protein